MKWGAPSLPEADPHLPQEAVGLLIEESDLVCACAGALVVYAPGHLGWGRSALAGADSAPRQPATPKHLTAPPLGHPQGFGVLVSR